MLRPINQTLRAQTLYEYMVVEDVPRLTQAGPACMRGLHYRTNMVLASYKKEQVVPPCLKYRKSGSSQVEQVTAMLRGERLMLK